MPSLLTRAHSTRVHAAVWQVTWPRSHVQNSQAEPFQISSWYLTSPRCKQLPAGDTQSSQHCPWCRARLWPWGSREKEGEGQWSGGHLSIGAKGHKTPSLYTIPWWLRWERICLQCRRSGFDPWVGKIPWRRKWQPTPIFLPGESHGQRSLMGYSSWAHKESDMDWASNTFTLPSPTSPNGGRFPSTPTSFLGGRCFLPLSHNLSIITLSLPSRDTLDQEMHLENDLDKGWRIKLHTPTYLFTS